MALGLGFSGAVLGGDKAARVRQSPDNFVVELRLLAQEEPQEPPVQGAGVGAPRVLRTQEPQPSPSPVQRVVVGNGARAHFGFSTSVLVQWVQAVLQQSSNTSSSTGELRVQDGRGVENSAAWLDTGQSLTVRPRWDAARQRVMLEVQVESAAAQANAQTSMPSQVRTRMASQLAVSLGQWTTIAMAGEPARTEAAASTYSSLSAQSTTLMRMQVRVLVP